MEKLECLEPDPFSELRRREIYCISSKYPDFVDWDLTHTSILFKKRIEKINKEMGINALVIMSARFVYCYVCDHFISTGKEFTANPLIRHCFGKGCNLYNFSIATKLNRHQRLLRMKKYGLWMDPNILIDSFEKFLKRKNEREYNKLVELNYFKKEIIFF